MEKRFMKGNEAIAESAIRAGCRFFAGYPITPQNEIPEYMSRKMTEAGGVFVQGESEIASAYMVFGGASMGTRCMTSSSGLGICLKTEALSYMAGARLPAVVVNVSRGGPGLGTIQPSQQDYNLITNGPGCGGFSCMVYAPSTVQESVDLTCKAFDMAERDRNPVIVLTDGCLGAMMESVELPMPQTPGENLEWSLAKSDRQARIIKSFHLDPMDQEQFNENMADLYKSWDDNDVAVELYQMQDAEYVITAYGICGRIAKAAVEELRLGGVKAGLLRPITLVPFPRKQLAELNPQKVKKVLSVEMSIPGQMFIDVREALSAEIPLEFLGRSGGVVVEEEEIVSAVYKMKG
ncbi:MAG: 3-methyl-2-oxobutanoate dehydrogenase subunit VorB [Oscillospiraceae bacterium]|nr:3-methyl-2-oxobutanoate dehydrogenase subunit VorB [Oscillospiraceae bacterium]